MRPGYPPLLLRWVGRNDRSFCARHDGSASPVNESRTPRWASTPPAPGCAAAQGAPQPLSWSLWATAQVSCLLGDSPAIGVLSTRSAVASSSAPRRASPTTAPSTSASRTGRSAFHVTSAFEWPARRRATRGMPLVLVRRLEVVIEFPVGDVVAESLALDDGVAEVEAEPDIGTRTQLSSEPVRLRPLRPDVGPLARDHESAPGSNLGRAHARAIRANNRPRPSPADASPAAGPGSGGHGQCAPRPSSG
jgi:hypothetical protein